MSGVLFLNLSSNAQFRIVSDGNINLAGNDWGQSPELELDVRGRMFLRHVPKANPNPNVQNFWSGVYFDVENNVEKVQMFPYN